MFCFRNVRVEVLNESRYIAVSVYNVVLSSIFVVVLSFILVERVTVSYIIVATPVLFSTTATLCILFLPKVKKLFRCLL